MTFADVKPRRRCACCGVPSNQCPCKACGACSSSGGDPVSACGCVPARPRRVTFDAAALARAHELAAALHPDGHCTCGGGGSCEWCRAHCLWCGALLTSSPCPCDEGRAPCPGEAVA